MLLTATISPLSATAEPHAVHEGLVAETPVSYTPDVLNGHVSAFVQVGDVMVAGGSFTKVEQDGKVFQRRNLFAFSATTGRILRNFHPQVYGEVFDLEVAPSQQSVVAVGNFSSIDRLAFTSRIARVRISTGLVDRAFRSHATQRHHS